MIDYCIAFFYISGQVAIDPDTGKVISDNLQDQVDLVFKNLKNAAEKAGGSLQNVVKVTSIFSVILAPDLRTNPVTGCYTLILNPNYKNWQA